MKKYDIPCFGARISVKKYQRRKQKTKTVIENSRGSSDNELDYEKESAGRL